MLYTLQIHSTIKGAFEESFPEQLIKIPHKVTEYTITNNPRLRKMRNQLYPIYTILVVIENTEGWDMYLSLRSSYKNEIDKVKLDINSQYIT